jgi:NAD(P)-dependent dehydrogenase (short-subunit alcohol dehydrogenase family)
LESEGDIVYILTPYSYQKESYNVMASYLITGCSRGLGLELTKLLSSSPTVSTVFATARSLTPDLEDVVNSSSGRVHFVPLDVTKDDSIAAAAEEVTRKLGSGNGLDVLVNNAGIQILEKDGVTRMHALSETLNVNVIAVHKVSSAFLPLLSCGTQKKLLIISSQLGSMANNEDFSKGAPFPSYKISKAAVNMLTVQYAMELGPKSFTVFAVNPGWLRTDMGGQHANLEPRIGARQVIKIIQEATAADNGSFRQIYVEGWEVYDGKNIPW